jgi:hypothetical protein
MTSRANGIALLSHTVGLSLHYMRSSVNFLLSAPVMPHLGKIRVDRPQPEEFVDPIPDPSPHTTDTPAILSA